LKDSGETEFLNRINESRRIIYKVVNLYVDGSEERKDLVQEIILQSFSSYGRFNGQSSFSTWLYRICLNTVFSYIKKENRRKQVEVDYKPENPEQPQPDEIKETLYQAVKRLDSIGKIAISLHFDGYSNPEIAEITGLKENHVAVKLHRCKQQLTRLLKP
jgi:RNA polymerase sigma-70 factor (ECF subfamily)